MTPFTLQEFSESLDGTWITRAHETAIEAIFIDSRVILHGKGSLFVPLTGNTVDGHDFISAAYEKGVRNFIVQIPGKAVPNELTGSNIYHVKDSVAALQHIAAWNRRRFEGVLIGITGSNGKTIVKEWLGQLLSNDYRVCKSPKSYNSQIGVPLSLFGLDSNYQVGIIEAGISRPGEMQNLEKMIQPDIAIFTNLGPAHDANFINREQKLNEKALLLQRANYIIFCSDHEPLCRFLKGNFPEDRLVSWSRKGAADYVFSCKRREEGSRIVMMKPDLGMFTFHTGFTDEASLENLCHVLTACLTLGVSTENIHDWLPQLKPIEMRLTLKSGINECLIIDDTYNNDLAGLEVAMQFMENQPLDKKRTLILSDLLQSGDEASVYEKVAELMAHYGVSRLVGVGSAITRHRKVFDVPAEFFPSTLAFIKNLSQDKFVNELILVKGARKFAFEEVVRGLEEKMHGTVLEINLNSLVQNFRYYRSLVSDATKLMVMVKASAYGGGAPEIAKQLQVMGADYLAVAYSDEGVELRKAGIKLPILVLNSNKEDFKHLVKYELEPVVYSLSLFKRLANFSLINDSPIKIHLDIDTGMKRLGFEEKDIDPLNEWIKTTPLLSVASIFTHLAAADDPSRDLFTQQQLKRFLDQAKKLSKTMKQKPLLHALNTAGIQRFPEYSLDMVRLGIGLYGVDPVGGTSLPLTQIGTLKTPIAQIKNVLPEESVGYGQKGHLAKGGKIATLNIGYADGFDRRFGNGVGFVLIHGQKAPTVGNVCMDMCMVDVSSIPSAAEGDEAVIYGEGMKLSDLAEKIGTIPYELLTNITQRVKRVYFWD